MLVTSKQETEINFNKREKRTPDSDSIQRWKLAFSGDLTIPLASSKKLPQMLTCNWVLHELCLKHVSCRELWVLFRRNCIVDDQNNCRMNNRNDCWQSFEGISWAGLGACTCPGNNSDCHWIRLQTNYNKCIYELSNDPSWHVQLNSLSQFSKQRRFGLTFPNNIPSNNVKMPDIGFKNGSEIKENEDESDEKRRRIMANEARLSRIYAQEQRKRAEQEIKHRKIEKFQKGKERGGKVNQNLYATPTTGLNTTVSIGNDATIKFQNIILKDEKPKQWSLQNKLNDDKKFKEHLNESAENQTKLEKHQNMFEHQNNNQKLTKKQIKLEQHNNSQVIFQHENNAKNIFDYQNNSQNMADEQKKFEKQNNHQNITGTNKHNFLTRRKFVDIKLKTKPTTLLRNHNNKNTEKLNNNSKNVSEIRLTPTTNSLQFFPTQSSETLMTQAETPPTKIYNLQIDQNKEGKTNNANNVTLNKNENSSIISTCPQIIQICEKDEITSCNWHLSELRIKCQQTFEKNNICLQKKREAKCSSALGRFVRFVSAQLVEAMMFCNVSQYSEENDMLNTLLHPTNCLFSSNEHKQQQWSCTQTAKMCKAEPYCSHRLNYLLSACPLSNISSSHSSTCLLPDNPSSLRKCRFALAKSRGTWLDEPCHCLPNGGGDFKECKKWEMTLWPKNPCIEKVTTDFNQLFIGGYLKLEQKRKNKTNNVLIKKTKIKEKELGSIEKGIFVIEDDKEGKSLDKEENISKEKINKKSNESSVESNQLVKHKIIEEANNITNKNEKENKNNNNELLSYYLDEKQENKEDKNIDQVEFIKKRKRPIGRKINSQNISELIDVNEFQTPIVSEGRGCRTRNIDGEWIEHYTDTIFRQFTDWSGRCSGWCECIVKGKENGNSDNVSSSHTIRCHSLGCLQDRLCETKHTTIVFGQRLYLENRGACLCHNGQFICDSSELQPELEPGIYISLGYSQAEIDIIREKVPKLILERSGIISHSNSIIKDLATRLQFALEKILPNGLKCRIVVLEHFKSEQGVLMQIQWFGIDHSANQTQAKWQSGKMEKHCSPYVRELELTFWLEKSERYQLLLSTIKQIRAVDLLDALPLSSSARRKIIFKNKWLTFLLSLLVIVLYKRFW